jgi:lysozyme
VIDALREQLIDHEGLKLHAYQDSLGYWTIGVGRLIDKRKGGRITRDEALYLLDNDIAEKIGELRAALPWFTTQDEIRQRALVDLAFNLGVPGLLTFKNTLAAWQRGDYAGAARGLQHSLWFKQVGRRGPRIVHMVKEGTEPV